MINPISNFDPKLMQSTMRKETTPGTNNPTKKLDAMIAGKGMSSDKVSLNGTATISPSYNGSFQSRVNSELTTDFKALRGLVIHYLTEQEKQFGLSPGEMTGHFDEINNPESAQGFMDGYWGIEEVSNRIFDFVVNAAGNDPSKLDQMKEAVDKGMEMAKNELGGHLPDISMKTYDAVMEKLDTWESNQRNQSPKPA